MIILKKISKVFGDNTAVNGISLKVKPGEIVGFLGPNGAGKTTTLRMMAGVLPQSEGDLTINGLNFEEHDLELKKQIGYLPENNPLYEEMTVEEHLRFWARMKNLGQNEGRQAIEFAVEKTGIGSVYYRLIGELSKGYRQRVGLAQAILAKPQILLLDEPTEGLDPNQRKEIQALLSDLKASRTVIVSSHVLSEIAKLASRIIIINEGRVVGDDSVGKLVQTGKGGTEVEVEIRGRGILTSLRSLKGVEEAVRTDKQLYRVKSLTAGTDLREEIFKLAVRKKWVLLTLKKLERELEDVFTELTEGR